MKRFIVALVALGAAALMLIPAGLASAKPPKAKTAAFRATGRTSQGGRLILVLASTGRKVQMTVEYTVSCDSGATFTDTETITGPSRPGGFSGHHISRVKFNFPASKSGTINTSIGPVAANLEIILAGNIRLDTGNAKGTIQPTLTLANGDKCTSGNTPITYSARF
jgi:hypothetical protein